jgi:type IV secretory pathway TraG/TraD family ATPase VirD4
MLIFEPGGGLKFNILDYILKRGGDARDITRFLMALNETIRDADGTGNVAFWEGQQDRAIFNAVTMVQLATGGVTAPHLQEFLTGAARRPEDLDNPVWQDGVHNRVLEAAYQAVKTPQQEANYQVAKRYFTGELPKMAVETSSSIMVGVYGLLHVLCTGEAKDLFSTETNVTPETMLTEGRSIAVNMSPTEFGAAGKICNAAWKWATQWSLLRRDAAPTDYFNVLFCDEAQQFVNSPDSEYLAQCRSHRGCMIFLTQSKHAYYAAMGGERGKHKVDALLANFNTKIATALADFETAQWLSNLVGRDLQMRFSGSSNPQGDMWDTLMGRSTTSTSFSMQMDHALEPNVFMHGMRTGSAINQYMVDGVVIKTAEPFASGHNWMFTSFSQR